MRAIIKRELRNFLKKPLFWLGLLLVIAGVYRSTTSYLQLHYFQSDREIRSHKHKTVNDVDITDGYIKSSPKRQLSDGLRAIQKQLVTVMKYTPKQAEDVIRTIRNKHMSVSQITTYMQKEHKFYGANYELREAQYHQGTKAEVNAYLRDKFKTHSFGYYYGRKFADFAGLYMCFFATILLALLFYRDTRKDTYELLHTKPIRAFSYIAGKAIGAFLVMAASLGVLSLIFGTLAAVHAGRQGLPFKAGEFLLPSLLYVLPNMLLIVAFYTLVSLAFKNPLPAVPLLFLYILYSNMGSTGPDGMFGYYGRPLAIMVRFPGNLMDTTAPPMAVINQPALLLAAVLLLAASAWLYKRRRVY